ncbi:chemotaxis protein [Campylobacter sp. RM12920]|uniref:Chemotaxis protein n=1 Tax=Campylobacter californiensis TaxID=1032243 RepID=A0ABD4JHE4_9BACT|nr:chemotaxis protein [Campylobacter sp. RM12919]MBE2987555.1 chemotaxis protein [Campylobacter sp. RM12920]
MTQEELDALMAGGLDDIMDEETTEPDTQDKVDSSVETKQETAPVKQEKESEDNDIDEEFVKGYRVNPQTAWPPPPPTDDHKMVNQLDDVTKDSEKKATEMFDKLDVINGFFMNAESSCGDLKKDIDKNIEIFTTLSEKFPGVDAFLEALKRNESMKETVENTIGDIQMGQDEIMMAMDMMQYQDIHRQKIERVINVMRALSKYMSSLFEGRIDDDKRVSSAVHIVGDTTTENLVSNDDIEALIESLGNK